MTFSEWLFMTSIFCTLPVWVVIVNCGILVHPLVNWLKFDDPDFLPVILLFGLPAGLILYLLWPTASLLLYGGIVIESIAKAAGATDCLSGKAVSFFPVAFVGAVYGRYLSSKYLPRIDAFFGVTNGFSWASKVYDAMGIAYTGYAVVKLGAKLVRKI